MNYPNLKLPQTQNDAEKSPNCWQCKHFAISWEKATPYMCHLMGFKSRLLPSLEVLRADGEACRGFMPKATSEQGGAVDSTLTAQSMRLASAAGKSQVSGPTKTFWQA
jgi:hypothetical protein